MKQKQDVEGRRQRGVLLREQSFQLLLGAVLGALVLLAPRPVVAGQNYFIEAVGPAPSQAESISETGYVVGAAFLPTSNGTLAPEAFVWIPRAIPTLGLGAGFNLLPDLGGDESWARDVNDHLQVVGSRLVEEGSSGQGFVRGFLWDRGAVQEIRFSNPPWPDSIAYGINNRGEIVGSEFSTFFCRPGIWLPEPAYGLPAGPQLLRGPYPEGEAFDINERGEITGHFSLACDTLASAMALWLPEPAYGLPAGSHLLASTFNPGTRGAAINDSGLIAGTSYGSGSYRAVAWRDGEIEFLDEERGPFQLNYAHDVNDAGLVVGEVYELDSVGGGERGLMQAATMWSDGTAIDLNSLLPPSSGWTLLAARGINNLGQIVGVGRLQGEVRAFLLSPFSVVPFFADDFESGDLSTWDLAVVSD